jgi:hypothetical protein
LTEGLLCFREIKQALKPRLIVNLTFCCWLLEWLTLPDCRCAGVFTEASSSNTLIANPAPFISTCISPAQQNAAETGPCLYHFSAVLVKPNNQIMICSASLPRLSYLASLRALSGTAIEINSQDLKIPSLSRL